MGPRHIVISVLLWSLGTWVAVAQEQTALEGHVTDGNGAEPRSARLFVSYGF